MDRHVLLMTTQGVVSVVSADKASQENCVKRVKNFCDLLEEFALIHMDCDVANRWVQCISW